MTMVDILATADSTSADFHTNLQAVQGVPANVTSQLTTAASPDQVQATQADALSGIQSVASGGTLSKSQIQSGLGLAAAGALSLSSGMALSAAMPIMLPLAAVLFASGAAIDALIKGALGIGMGSNWACDPRDKTQYGDSPSDPKWRHTLSPSLYDNWTGNAPYSWKPATNGKFETWARPILMLANDIAGNCHAVPGVKPTNPDTIKHAYETGSTVDWQKEAQLNRAKWEQGLIKVWNDSNPGAPMRTIKQDIKLGMNDPKLFDPIQDMLWRFRRILPQYASQLKGNIPISIQVADPSPAHVVKKTLPLHLGSAVAVAKVAPTHLANANIVVTKTSPVPQAIVPGKAIGGASSSNYLAMAGGAAVGFAVAGPIGAGVGAVIGWGAGKLLKKS
jgi:hypothetical protein